METVAIHRGARSSAYKVRLVADMLRGRRVGEALEILHFSPQKAAALLEKVLKSAIANAVHNAHADVDGLRVSRINIDEGPTMKRVHPRARGRADRIFKRSCHISVCVGDSAA